MAAYFRAVGIFAQVIGVVDGPAREPEHLLFQLAQDVDVVGHDGTLARSPRGGNERVFSAVQPWDWPARRARLCRPAAGRPASGPLPEALAVPAVSAWDAAPCRKTSTPAPWARSRHRPAPAAACGNSASRPDISAARGCGRHGRTRAAPWPSTGNDPCPRCGTVPS